MRFSTPTIIVAALTLSSSVSAHYMDIVGDWRQRMGLPQLIYNANLERNALKTVIAGNGQAVHQLNPGSAGQVLGPEGPTDSNFWSLFVGGWLCQLPSAPGMNGICATAGQGWYHNGQTGHAQILRSTSYKTMGCAHHKGIWACDLGF